MSFAPEGKRILVFSGLLALALTAISLWFDISCGYEGRLIWLPALGFVWFALAAQFFRDPERFPPSNPKLILSPADGTIISIGDAQESPITPHLMRVSIFMSPINVHVNRAPVAGTIVSFEHKEGRFLGAFKPQASRENEQTIIVMESKYGPVAFKQIAGFLARRIVFHPKAGDTLKAGERVGMIKFGSRADIFFSDKVRIKVKLGDKVSAGETIIGEFVDA